MHTLWFLTSFHRSHKVKTKFPSHLHAYCERLVALFKNRKQFLLVFNRFHSLAKDDYCKRLNTNEKEIAPTLTHIRYLINGSKDRVENQIYRNARDHWQIERV